MPALTSYPDRSLHNQKAAVPIDPVLGPGARGKTKALRRIRYRGTFEGPQGSLYGIRAGAPLEDPGPYRSLCSEHVLAAARLKPRPYGTYPCCSLETNSSTEMAVKVW